MDYRTKIDRANEPRKSRLLCVFCQWAGPSTATPVQGDRQICPKCGKMIRKVTQAGEK